MWQRLALAVSLALGCACATQRSALAAAEAPPREATSMGATEKKPVEMVDLRANLQIEVPNVAEAAAKLRQLAAEATAQIVADDIKSNGWRETGSFDLRVPAAKAKAFLDAAGALGRVALRNVTETDVSKEFHDSEIQLRNLKATLQRYEELLAKATDVKDMLAIEAELGRVRGQIDRVTGERRWLEDRVARATIHIDLLPVRPVLAPEPQAKFYPGLKGSFFAGMGKTRLNYVGTGASVQFGARGSIDLDVLKSTKSPDSLLDGADLLLLTIGGEAYSDFLGGGKRRFLNPYLGFRLGYGRSAGHSAFALGGTAGLELVRVKYFVLDVQEQGIGLIGGSVTPGFGFMTSVTGRLVF
jgi:hypothetical protein